MQASHGVPELPNFLTLIERHFHGSAWVEHLPAWENIIFALIVAAVLIFIAYKGTNRRGLIPSTRLQTAVELYASLIDDFVCGIIGPKGRQFTPFIGTLFIYVLMMNLLGLVPLMKSPTASWSITLALSLCVFVYATFTGIKEMGFVGYVDHLMEKPRGIMAFTIIYPVFMLFLHVVTELIKPVTLSLRLRSNIWGDEVLLSVISSFGLTGVPLMLFSTFIVLIGATVQALVFTSLTTIYFSMAMPHEEGHKDTDQIKEGVL